MRVVHVVQACDGRVVRVEHVVRRVEQVRRLATAVRVRGLQVREALHVRLEDGTMIRARIGAHESAPPSETFTVGLRREPVVLAATGD